MVRRKRNRFWCHVVREIWGSRSRFFSILAIVAIGVGFFGGVRAAGPDMRLSADTYYKESNLMDFRLLSTVGFTEEDVQALQQLSGVQVYPSQFVDCIEKAEGSDKAVRVASLEDTDQVNKIELTSGRMPQAPGECLVDGGGLHAAAAQGTVLTLEGDRGSELSDTLNTTEFVVVGTFLSPLYVDATGRGSTTVGDGSISDVLLIPKENFKTEVYTQVYLTVEELSSLNAYTQEYDDARDAWAKKLEDVAAQRTPVRLQEIRTEYEDALKEGEEKLADARQQLQDGEKELEDARQQLTEGENKLQQARQTLADSRTKLDDGWAQLNQGQQALTDGINTAWNQYNTNAAQYQTQKAALDTQLDAVAGAVTALGNETLAQSFLALKQDSDPTAALQQISALQAQVESLAQLLPQEQVTGMQTLLSGCTQLMQAKQQLNAAAAQINAQQAQGQAGLDASRQTLESGEQEYADGLAKLQTSQQEYDENKAEFEEQEPKAQQDLADGRAEVQQGEADLQQARQELADLAEPSWYVFDRDDNPGYAEYGQNAQRVANIAKIFPVLFLLVAALVSLTTMERMVEEQRTQIGTLKALGYTNGLILAKYMIYAVGATVLGSLLGLIVGFQLFPRVIVTAYGILYRIPTIVTPFRWPMALSAGGAAVVCVALTVYFSCRSEFVQLPARLMRPKTPPQGKKILLERLSFFWKRLNFIQKVSARNIFRYKKRMLMALIGISGCTALVLTGFALKDSIQNIIGYQFERIWTYSATAVLDTGAGEADLAAVGKVLQQADEAAEWLPTMQKSYTAVGPEGRCDVTVLVGKDFESLPNFISLQDRRTGTALTPGPQDILITEKMSTLLGLQVGDTFTVQNESGVNVQLTVNGITENYVYHYAYMSPETYQAFFGEEPEWNSVLCRCPNLSAEQESALSTRLLDCDKVVQVSLLSDISSNFGNVIGVLNLVVVVLIVSAGALAFVVLYNLTNINITERIREIATLKVLGFYDREVSAYIFRENLVLTLMGAACGLVLGHWMGMTVITTAEIDMVMFGRDISVWSSVYAFTLTLVFSVVVSLCMHKNLRRISMVESLKSVE